jgi:hypothetical protein
MDKRKLWGIIAAAGLAVFITLYVLFFNKRNETALNAMPEDVLCFFDVQSANDFSVLLNHDAMFTVLRETQLIGALHQDMNLYASAVSTNPKILSDLLNNHLIAGAFTSGNASIDYLILLQLDEGVKVKPESFSPSINNIAPQKKSHVFEKTTIYELTYPGTDTSFSFTIENGIFIYSTSPVLVENAILQLKKGNPVTENPAFNEVYNQLKSANGITYYVNVPQLADYFSMFALNEKYSTIMQMKNYASWIGLHPELKPNGITLNGYASAKGADKTLNMSKHAGAFSTDMHAAVPSNTAVLYRINADQLSENIAAGLKNESLNRDFFDYWSPWMTQQLLVGISESLDGNISNRAYAVIPANDKKLAESKLKYATISDTLVYRNYNIITLSCSELVSAISGIAAPDLIYATWHNESLLLGFDKLQITNMIDAIENKNTLVADANYMQFKQEVSASFNNSVYIDFSKSLPIIKDFISDKHINKAEPLFPLLQQFSHMELQFTANKDLYMVNGFIQFQSNPTRKSGLLWKVDMTAPIESGPFTVYNQLSQQQSILVQDTTHLLYFISANGDVLWKQQMQGKILSTIHEVDFYGNDKTQFLFNTDNGIYLVDVNGEPVEGFPITLTTKITNAVSVVMNTDNDYRMFVACENGNIYGYYKDGKPIAGWNPQKNAGQITQPLFTIKSNKGLAIGYINNSAVLLKKENGQALQSIPFASGFADIYSFNSGIGLMDKKGNVIVIDSLLKVSTITAADELMYAAFTDVKNDDSLDIVFIEDDYFKASSVSGKNIFVTEAVATVSGVMNMQFNHQNYFGYYTMDSQLYLFTEEGKLADGFPVQGSNRAVVDDISGSGDNVLITVVGNMLLAYRIL